MSEEWLIGRVLEDPIQLAYPNLAPRQPMTSLWLVTPSSASPRAVLLVEKPER